MAKGDIVYLDGVKNKVIGEVVIGGDKLVFYMPV